MYVYLAIEIVMVALVLLALNFKSREDAF